MRITHPNNYLMIQSGKDIYIGPSVEWLQPLGIKLSLLITLGNFYIKTNGTWYITEAKIVESIV